MDAYFCVAVSAKRRLQWFVSRDPGYAAQARGARLVHFQVAPDSLSAHNLAEQFAGLSWRERREFVRLLNPKMKTLEPPKVPVAAGRGNHSGPADTDPLGMVRSLELDDDWGGSAPGGGVRSFSPRGPISRPGADAVPFPVNYYQLDATRNGFSRLATV